MEDISNIKFRKLRKNKSDDDTKSFRKSILHNKQSTLHTTENTRQSTPLRTSSSSPSPPSLPSSPPSHHHVPFHSRQLGDWCRAKRLDEILSIFPADMSLHEFSHLSPKIRQVSLGSPGRLVSVSAHYTDSDTPMVIPHKPRQVVVRDPRMKEKVMVAITAARAARRQAEEVGNTPGGSPITLSPNRRSLDVDSLGLLHHSRFGSASHRLSRELSITNVSTLSTKSLNTLGLGHNRMTSSCISGSAGNLQSGTTGGVVVCGGDFNMNTHAEV